MDNESTPDFHSDQSPFDTSLGFETCAVESSGLALEASEDLLF